ncbi:hypothetical protein Celaphus_00010213 [Cervus elaphus hippelaphus]|uniref:Uncharacterized protein n=1 Tax=Cervus elaphus hippelaphus TaxID=46360 RepID=A0A212C9N9_CEREH|nr:hypothetical protein Celaphus_00010213 [Cervus elaphus hippelaphus]
MPGFPHKIKAFLAHFQPQGTPIPLSPVLVLITTGQLWHSYGLGPPHPYDSHALILITVLKFAVALIHAEEVIPLGSLYLQHSMPHQTPAHQSES